jgi:hypothetical protein
MTLLPGHGIGQWLYGTGTEDASFAFVLLLNLPF